MKLFGKILFTVAAVGAAATMSVNGTFATFTAETTNPSNVFANGTLVLSDKVGAGTACLSTAGGSTDSNANVACDAAFNLTVRKPGDSSTANLTLKNEGSLAASALKVFAGGCASADASTETYHGTGDPCTKVQLYVQQYSDAAFSVPSVCLYGGAVGDTCDFSDATKTLGAFSTAYPSSAAGLGTGSLASGASRYVKVGVKLPADANNTFQGRKATIDLSWSVEQ